MGALHKPEEVALEYKDSKGNSHFQVVSDIVSVGTLIDPDTGDDMDIVKVWTGNIISLVNY